MFLVATNEEWIKCTGERMERNWWIG
jgi:hypothetical protein